MISFGAHCEEEVGGVPKVAGKILANVFPSDDCSLSTKKKKKFEKAVSNDVWHRGHVSGNQMKKKNVVLYAIV